jgi:MFS family permease
LIFALFGGAAFKSLEVVLGPFLIDRGFDRSDVGWFSAGPMNGLMLAGAVVGGILPDRVVRKPCVMIALGTVVSSIGMLAVADWLAGHGRGHHLLSLLSVTAFAIGLFTSASYALFMDITDPRIAAKQFSAFMGATNGCESWSSFAMGKIVAASGYPVAMLCLCGVSICALPVLSAMRIASRRPKESPTPQPS